jgi:hypothetical protein
MGVASWMRPMKIRESVIPFRNNAPSPCINICATASPSGASKFHYHFRGSNAAGTFSLLRLLSCLDFWLGG